MNFIDLSVKKENIYILDARRGLLFFKYQNSEIVEQEY
jgi:hypothetical protein